MTKKPTRSRSHKWGAIERHSDVRDGNYQVCAECGATRFEGQRYAFGRVACVTIAGGRKRMPAHGGVKVISALTDAARAQAVFRTLSPEMRELLIRMARAPDGEVKCSGWRNTPQALMSRDLGLGDSFMSNMTIVITPLGRRVAKLLSAQRFKAAKGRLDAT